MKLEALIAMMKSEYGSEARRNLVQAELESLTLSVFMSNRSIMREEQGPMDTTNHINILDLQTPHVFQSDVVKLRNLRHALFSCSWGHTSLKKINDDGMTFTSMISSLRDNIQFHLEQRGQKQSAIFYSNTETVSYPFWHWYHRGY